MDCECVSNLSPEERTSVLHPDGGQGWPCAPGQLWGLEQQGAGLLFK